MAISVVQYRIIRDLFENGRLPKNGALLEIGEANWYGDLDPRTMVGDIQKYVVEPDRRDALIKRLSDIIEKQEPTVGFQIAKVFYELFFAPSELQAVDFGGTPVAHKLDLNGSISLGCRFDVVMNHGTAEHVFNIAQVFKTIHDYTLPGGLMIHESPFTGWIEHGFYNLQPTLFYDLADRNGYSIVGMIIEDLRDRSIIPIKAREDVYELAKTQKIPDNAMLLTVLAKGADERPFGIPIQGYYRASLPEIGMSAWREQR